MWFGSDALRDVWLIYTGVTLAPWSEHIFEPGWRLRAHSGYGQFRDAVDTGAGHLARYTGSVSYVDALAGYHWRSGDLTVKIFAGMAAIDRTGTRGVHTAKGIFGREYGPKGVVELWLNLDDKQWTSLNLSFTTAHTTASGRWRYGYKVLPELSIGPEIRFDTNDFRNPDAHSFFDHFLGRTGLFATYKWSDSVELSIAGGIGSNFRGTHREAGERSTTPYATANVLLQF